MRRCWLTLGVALLAGLTLVSGAAADKEKIHLTNAGQAAARAAVIRRADLGVAAAWTGGALKPDLSGAIPCSSFHPKQSDLVLTGAAQTIWKHPGLEFESDAQVLLTPAMVRLDWQRTVLAPEMLPCLRSGLARNLGASARLVSFAQVAFPQLAPYTRAYRALADVTVATGTVRVLIDVVLVGRGRTEITLSATAPLAAEPVVHAAELRLARLLASRIRT